MEWYGAIEVDLMEGTTGNLKFKGKLQEADSINKNKRQYPFEVLDKNVSRLQECVAARALIGELDHPTDSIVHFEKASHVITKLWWEGNTLMGEGEILPTPHGKVLRSLMESGIRIGMSSRGVGTGKTNEDGVLVIGESYKLITFDAVADPSTHEAFQERVVGSKRESVLPQNIKVRETKNETSSININTDTWKALLGGIIREHTDKIKRG